MITLMRSPDSTVRMPKNAGSVIDTAGVKLIEDWVQSRTSCP